MALIDRFMPTAALRQVDHVAVAASVGNAWPAVRALDLAKVRIARPLFRLRTLPERAIARARGGPAPPVSSTIDDITRPGSGFLLLGEERGREVVVGAVGKFWLPVIEWAPIAPARFTRFAEPGFGKLAFCLRVEPRVGGGSWIGFDLRVDATDEESLRRFARYWFLIGRFSHAIRHAGLRKLQRDLGEPETSDDARILPGDEILPRARGQRTHAITIEAPPGEVWPWLVQMGCRRAGWYSLDLLDNGGEPSADHIVTELQHLEVGDILPARPTGEGGFAVLRLEPERVLVLGPPSLQGDDAPPWGVPYLATWAFILDPIGDEATRLLVRVRGDFEPTAKNRAVVALALVAHEVMERAQLRNLKRRAEVNAHPPVVG